MAWSKAKKSIVWGIAAVATVLIVIGGVEFFHWLRDPDRIAAAKEARANAKGEKTVAKHIAEPVDLTGHTQGPVWDYVPTGFQTFLNVPLQIDNMILLWGEGGAANGMNLPEEVTGITVGRKFETLYVYEGSFYGSPSGTPVYEIVFRYDDGESATNQILYGKDLLDWYAKGGKKKPIGPTAPRSRLAWQGEAERNGKIQQLCFCMTAVENPFPGTTVTSVDLYSSKHRTVPCILAMTPGKAGLMPETKEAQKH